MKNIFKHIKFIPLVFLLLVSCEDLDLAPEDRFTDSNYWTSVEKAQLMLNTAYSQMQKSQYFFYNEALSDNAYNGRGDNAGAASIGAGLYDPSLGRIKEEWNDRYGGIKSCNLLLENIDRVPNADPGVITRMKAEARFIRAFQHFQLTTWFGDIPLLQKDPSLSEATTISRTSHAEVIQFVLDELNAVIPALPKNTQLATADRGKITMGAAVALKARVLLYEGKWQEVVQTLEPFLTNTYGTYSLFPSYEGLFQQQNEYNSEDILSLQYVPIDRTWSEFFDMAPISAGSRLNALAPTQELVDSYLMLNGKKINETGSGYNENDPYVNRDPRLTYTVVYDQYNWKEADGSSHIIYIKPGSSPTNEHPDEFAQGSSSTPTGYFTRKYYDVQHGTDLKSGINLMLFRYADVLLMYAEAKNELSQMTSTVWDQTIKSIRSRAGFTDAAALNYNGALGQAGLKEVIRNERRTEFGMEGLRIFDIRRWKIAENVLNGYAHGAKFGVSSVDNGYLRVNLRTFDPGKHYLWPIPRDERLINTNLSQNPNW
ncbi:RagB/SusD family nutrient uptake outer membrane protein [Flavobacterium sp. WLB]|uniref:RagB/SusD family nutrient uptake outer membrane protein n=1 Tax=unclassified Flavobacterium TaxID=196869 RepID=UPI000AC73854|nr:MULTISPECIES: RagB/SusD family nutrient uptake outer membrane protein [unclassified Flavobacterium]PUU71160.1 RagB/SusD family nutrient uptake outer membrane protein [Flavobacterium sp. WLB]